MTYTNLRLNLPKNISIYFVQLQESCSPQVDYVERIIDELYYCLPYLQSRLCHSAKRILPSSSTSDAHVEFISLRAKRVLASLSPQLCMGPTKVI